MKYLIALFFCFYTTATYATKPVIDIANLVKNTLIATQTQNQTQVQLKQLVEQVQMYKNMVENSKKLPDFKTSYQLLGRVPGSPAEAIAGANYTSERVLQMMRNIERIQKAQQGILDTSADLYKASRTSGLSAAQIIALDLKNRNVLRENSMNFYDLYKSYGDEISSNQARNDQITNQLATTGGAHQTLMTMGLQNRLLSDQINQLISIQAAAQQKASADDLNDQDKEELRKSRRKAFLETRERNLKKWGN